MKHNPKSVDGVTYDAAILEYKRMEYKTFCEKQKIYLDLPWWKKIFVQKPYETLSAYQYALYHSHDCHCLNKRYKNK